LFDVLRASCSLTYELRRVAVELILECFVLPLIVGVYCKAFSLEMVSFEGKLCPFCRRS